MGLRPTSLPFWTRATQTSTPISTIITMAQPFGSRSYAGGKLPDRSVNSNAVPFGASSFSRHRGLGATVPGDFADTGAGGPKATQTGPGLGVVHAQTHGPSAQDTNPLNRLTEEQREEINEAVSTQPTQKHPERQKERYVNLLCIVHPLRPRPRPPPRLP